MIWATQKQFVVLIDGERTKEIMDSRKEVDDKVRLLQDIFSKVIITSVATKVFLILIQLDVINSYHHRCRTSQ